MEVSTDGEYEIWDWNWYSDESSIGIRSYDGIQVLIDKIIQENIDELLDEFSSDDRGSLSIHINAIERELTFGATVYIMDIEYSTIMENFNEISNKDVTDYLTELGNNFSNAKVHYEGGGDSGYIESAMDMDSGNSEDIPAPFEDYLYRLLNHFGGWEINEGSQGDIYINFDEKTITVEHGSNYEEEKRVNIPLRYKF
jgi:hypothetical protein